MITDSEYSTEHSGYQADTPGGPCSPYGCSWVAGMMVVNPEDLDTVAESRPVECERCERVYDPSQADDPGAQEAWDHDDHIGLPWGGTG